MAGRPELKINSGFAQKYDKYRQKEELQRRPAISDEKASTSKKAVKPMFLKDYERKVILEKEGKYEDDDDSDDEEAARRMDERASSPSYIQEQRQLRDSFRKFIQDSDEEEEVPEREGGSELLTRRIKSQDEEDKEEKDFVEWLKDKTDLEGPEEVKDLLDDKECFLRDYVLNKGYKEEEEGGDERMTWRTLRRKASLSWSVRRTLKGNTTSATRAGRSASQNVPAKHRHLREDQGRRRKLKRDEKFFGDEYYGGAEDEKPQFEADEELEDGCRLRPQPADGLKKKKKKERKTMKKEDLPQSGKKRRKSHFAEYLDEYYKLDYEDIIDDLPCRFRYRQVLPNDFGLSTEEILHADDKELNQWASLKKTCMFRSDKEESSDLHNYKIKAKNVGKKRTDHLKNQNGETEEAESTSIMDSTEETLVTLKEAGDNNEEEEEVLIPKKKMKQEEESQVAAAEKPVEVRNRTERTKWPKAKLKSSAGRRPSSGGLAGVRIGGREFSQQRLKAYGLNPKRLFFRQLGRQRRKDQERWTSRKTRREDGQGVRCHLRNIPAVQSCALSVEDISHPQN
ncbi:hypothetical protein F7725_003937, partial [Dissostichus mawsoni]